MNGLVSPLKCPIPAGKQKAPKERSDPLGRVNLASVLAGPSLFSFNQYLFMSDLNFAIILWLDVNYLKYATAQAAG